MSRLAIVVGIVCVSVISTVTGGRAADLDLRAIAARVAGGAALAQELGHGPAEKFADRTRRLAELVRDGAPRPDVERAWHRARSAYRAVRLANRRDRDDRWEFLLTHLDGDVAALDRILGEGPPRGSEGAPGAPRTLSLVRSETCIGRNQVGRPCPEPRDSISFTLPREVERLRRIDAEWRDFGRGAKGEVYVDDRLVWSEDVNKDWDGDGKKLDLELRGKTRIVVRSSNGDPIWIRKLTVEVED